MKITYRRLMTRVIIVIIAAFVLLVASVEWTSRPQFCSTCHFMTPYYNSWQNSSHHEVPCLKCHYPPGINNLIKAKIAGFSQLVQYVTHTYGTKPWAEIDDASCLRSGCHAHQKLLGPIEFKEGIFFNHKAHLGRLRRGKKLRCTSCHSQIVQGQHLTVTPTTCFLCHFKNVEGADKRMSRCTTCHHIKKIPKKRFDHAFVARKSIPCRQCHGGMVVGTGDVPKQHCYSCHAEQARLDKYGDVDFIHLNHVTRHKVECTQCHLTIQHKTQKISLTRDLPCRSCHEKTHDSQRKLFLGYGGRGTMLEPSKMLKSNVHCTGCHLFPKRKDGETTYYASGHSCRSCHGEGFDRVLADWKRVLSKAMKQADYALKGGERILRRHPVPTRSQKLIQAARDNLNLVHQAHGVHNFLYAINLLDTSIKFVNQALEYAGVERSFKRITLAETLTANPCAQCHIRPPDKTLNVFGRKFPHGRHIGLKGVRCIVCHSPYSNHGKIVLQSSDCRVCHGGITMPHPEDWLETHPETALDRGKEVCGKCHEDAFCASCHEE